MYRAFIFIKLHFLPTPRLACAQKVQIDKNDSSVTRICNNSNRLMLGPPICYSSMQSMCARNSKWECKFHCAPKMDYDWLSTNNDCIKTSLISNLEYHTQMLNIVALIILSFSPQQLRPWEPGPHPALNSLKKLGQGQPQPLGKRGPLHTYFNPSAWQYRGGILQALEAASQNHQP